MQRITDADREAAKALRETLADASGFWFRHGDDGPLCAALARHRAEAERRLLQDLVSSMKKAAPSVNVQNGVSRIANDLEAKSVRSGQGARRSS
jgi:hypothetical protein